MPSWVTDGQRRGYDRNSGPLAPRVDRLVEGLQDLVVGADVELPVVAIDATGSPVSIAAMAPSIRPSIGIPMARATIVTCAVREPSSTTIPRSLPRSYSSRSAAPRLRAIRIVSSGELGRVVAARLADQQPQQAVGDVVEVDQPLAQIGVAGVPDPDPGLLLHPTHRRLGRKAGPDRLADPAQPARVLREHAIGLEHLALLAAADLAGRQHLIERVAQPHWWTGRARASSACGFSASRRVTSTRGSCSQAWPIATPRPAAARRAGAWRWHRRRCRHTWSGRSARPSRTSRPGSRR